MYTKNGIPIDPKKPYVSKGMRWDSFEEWLAKSSPEVVAMEVFEKAPEVKQMDSRFFWDGNPNYPKDVEEMRAMCLKHLSAECHARLLPTDWMVVRALELPNKPVPNAVKDEREEIRTCAQLNEANILACTTTEELASLNLLWSIKTEEV